MSKMWIFGYGSLVWKVDFPYEERVVGHIKGYIRRFWQASVDHRGVPGNPGRVVTLIKTGNEEDRVWGAAYKVTDSVLSHGGKLDTREQKYTERVVIPVFTPAANVLNALVFVGTVDPELLLGAAPLDEMAEQIARSVGPSGPNYVYLFNLAEFLKKETPIEDDETLSLEGLVRTLLSKAE